MECSGVTLADMSASGPQARRRHDHGAPQVLLVEASDVTGLDLEEALKGAGFAPIGPFRSAGLALACIDRARPDCAIIELLDDDDIPRLTGALRRQGVPFAIQSQAEPAAEYLGVPRLVGPVWHRDAVSIVQSLLAARPGS